MLGPESEKVTLPGWMPTVAFTVAARPTSDPVTVILQVGDDLISLVGLSQWPESVTRTVAVAGHWNIPKRRLE